MRINQSINVIRRFWRAWYIIKMWHPQRLPWCFNKFLGRTLYLWSWLFIFPASLLPTGIAPPSLTYSFTSLDDMKLVCTVGNLPSYGIEYNVHWFKQGAWYAGQMTSQIPEGQSSISMKIVSSDLMNNFQVSTFIESAGVFPGYDIWTSTWATKIPQHPYQYMFWIVILYTQ